MKFTDLKVGMEISGFSVDGNYPDDEFRVEVISVDYAVLRNIDSGNVSSYLLEPLDFDVYEIKQLEK